MILACAATLPAEGIVASQNENDGGIAAAAESSDIRHPEVSTQHSRLRGTGILILDPRDSEEMVKERVRRFLFGSEGGILPEARQAEIEREVDALLTADRDTSNQLPQISFVFHRKITLKVFRNLVLESDLARQSEQVCPTACPFRALDDHGLHIHLTKPLGGHGDTVLALRIDESEGSPEEALRDRLADAMDLRRDWMKRYSELGNEWKPVGRLFGVQVFLGDPRSEGGCCHGRQIDSLDHTRSSS